MIGRPYLYEEARRQRIIKGLSQVEAARLYHRNQSFISRLEQGQIDDLEEERAYLDWLLARRNRRHRFSGGQHKIGPKRQRPKDPRRYRGTPLESDTYYTARLAARGWSLLALTRCADDMEIAFAYRAETDEFGMIGFLKSDGALRMLEPIRFSPEWDQNSGDALEAFGAGRFPSEAYDAAMAP